MTRAAREPTIQKLERLVWDTTYGLQKAGLDTEASRLHGATQRDRNKPSVAPDILLRAP